MDVKWDSKKDLCNAVFCMTVPLVQHTHTHTYTAYGNMDAGLFYSSALLWQSNKTLSRLLNELLRPGGQIVQLFRKHTHK